MSNIKTVALLGAGNRGSEIYGQYILNHPDKIKIIAVAEPDEEKRKKISKEHNIPEELQFESWKQLLARERLAKGIIIATLDNMHVEPALQAIKKGYKILMEKPIAPDLEGVQKISSAAEKYNAEILVAHVLRYTNFYKKLKDLLSEKIIGDIRFVDHIENIGYFHFAHSYVRGNWRNTQVAAPIILAKSCHDLDLIYWLLGKRCLKLSSQGTLGYFTKENQPLEGTERCLDCPENIEKNCPFSACKIYLNENTAWPVTVITDDLSYEGRLNALKEGPYGRCVYNCDNNVPDTQTVRMTFEGNIEVNFALTAFSHEINRTSKFFGSLGEIRADFEHNLIEVYRFGEEVEKIEVPPAQGGHGGGDTGLMNHFVEFLKREDNKKSSNIYETTIKESTASHFMAFAAEESRKEDIVVDLTKE